MQKPIKLTIPIKNVIQTQSIFFETESQLLQHLENRFSNSVFIFDERFKKNKFIEKFPHRFAVPSGEATKSLESLSLFLKELSLKKIDAISKTELSFIAMGGGSIGDFAGFVASIYKRGCPLIQIPTTWLAAIDSSHGGKNALNLKSKNQIGTIHYPSEVLICQKLLREQSTDLMISALGEVVKSGLLSPSLFREFRSLEILEFEDFFKLVPLCIEIKNFFLKKDPFEINGDRFYLNLGHTVGHGLEAHYQLNHGMAVLCGLEFMLRWSVEKKYIQKKTVLKLIPKNLITVLRNALKQQQISYSKMIKNKKFMEYILADKKRDKRNQIKEVFLFEKECRIVLIPIAEFELERQRQTKEGQFGSLLF